MELFRSVSSLFGGGGGSGGGSAAPPSPGHAPETGGSERGFLGEMWGKATSYLGELQRSPEVQAQLALQQKAAAEAKALADEVTHTSFDSQDALDHKLKGKSEAQIAEMRAQYEALNGPGAWETRFGTTDNRRWQRMAEVDQKKVKEAASALFNAMDGMGTDENGVVSALRGKTPDEIAEIRRLYAEMYPGRSLDDDVGGEVGGDYGVEVQALLGGDQVTAAVQGLFNASDGVGTDEDKIEEILRLVPADKRAEVAARYQEQFGVDLKDMLQGEFSFSEEDAMLALAGGETNKADAIRLDSAMNGGFLGIGADKEKVHDILEQSADPGGLTDAYKEVQDEKWFGGDASLDAGLADELDGADLDAARLALQAGDDEHPEVAAQARIELAAARIEMAAAGAGTDEHGLWKELAGKKPEEQKAIIDAWTKKYGGGAGKEKFFEMLGGEMDGIDPAIAAQVKEGKLDPTVALRMASLQYAMSGAGTDEQLVKDTLKGLKPAEIEAIRTAFTAAGRDLDKELLGDKQSDVPEEQVGELTGRDAFDVQQMLKGEPQTVEEKLARMKERYAWERDDGNDFVDVFSDSGEALDAKYAQVLALEEKVNADGVVSDEERFALERQLDYIDGTQGSYAAAKDRIADTAASVATAAGGLAITLATGGLGATIAAIAGAGGGGAAGMLTKYAIKGNAYGEEEMGLDTVKTLISMGTAGLGQSGALGDFVKANATSVLGREALKGLLTSFASSSLTGLTNDRLWEEGEIGAYLAGVASGTVGGVAQNLGTAGVGAALGGRFQGLDPVTAKTLFGVAGGMGGGVAQTLVDYNAYQGGFDGFAQAMAMSSGLGAMNGGAYGAAEGMKEKAFFTVPDAPAPLQVGAAQSGDVIFGLDAQPEAAPAAARPYEGLDLSGVHSSAPTTDDPRILLGIALADEGQAVTADKGVVTENAANPKARQELAQAKLATMDADGADFVRGMVDYAENDGQRTMIERAVAAGRSPGEIIALVDGMRGKSEEQILSEYSGAGHTQKAGQSCVPSSYQVSNAHVDPVAADLLHADPLAAVKQQYEALKARGATPSQPAMTPQMMAELASNPDVAEYILKEAGAPGSHGIDPSKMKDHELHAQLEASTGDKYEFLGGKGAHWSDADGTYKIGGEVPHDQVQSALDAGKPVMFGAKGHYRTIVGTGTAADGSPGYICINTSTGAYEVVPMTALDNDPKYQAVAFTVPGDKDGAPVPLAAGGKDAALMAGEHDTIEMPAIRPEDFEDALTQQKGAGLDDDATPVDQKVPTPEEIEQAAKASDDDDIMALGKNIAGNMVDVPAPATPAETLGWKARVGSFFKNLGSKVTSFFSSVFDRSPAAEVESRPTESSEERMVRLRKELLEGKASAEDELLQIGDSIKREMKERLDRIRPYLGSLDDDEVKMLVSYTNNDFDELNKAMRGHPDISPQRVAELQPKIALMKQAMAKLPVHQGTVFRGADISQSRMDEWLAKVGTPETVHDAGVSSSSTSADIASRSDYVSEGTPEKADKVKVMVYIQSKTGRDIMPLSSKPDEQEVIFMPGTKFQISKINPCGERDYQVWMTESDDVGAAQQ